jgi:hypothetical protein
MPRIPKYTAAPPACSASATIKNALAELATDLASKRDLYTCLHGSQFMAEVSRWHLTSFRLYLKRLDELVSKDGPRDQISNIRAISP